MLSPMQHKKIAASLFSALKSGKALTPITETHPGISIDDAYKISLAFLDLRVVKNNEKIANVANLMVNDDVITINVEKSDWSSHLNFSIAYFERIEDYETCIEINNILKGL